MEITLLIIENHGKIMELWFWISVGTLSKQMGKLNFFRDKHRDKKMSTMLHSKTCGIKFCSWLINSVVVKTGFHNFFYKICCNIWQLYQPGHVHCCFIWAPSWKILLMPYSNNMGPNARKPVVGISDQVMLKAAYSARETSLNLEISLVANLNRYDIFEY